MGSLLALVLEVTILEPATMCFSGRPTLSQAEEPPLHTAHRILPRHQAEHSSHFSALKRTRLDIPTQAHAFRILIPNLYFEKVKNAGKPPVQSDTMTPKDAGTLKTCRAASTH